MTNKLEKFVACAVYLIAVTISAILIAAFFLSGCTPRPLKTASIADPTPIPAVLDQYTHAVAILIQCPDGQISGGTGVITTNNRVVTANHVIRCGKSDELFAKIILISQTKDKWFKGTPYLSDAKTDLATLGIEGKFPTESYATLGNKPKVGDTVCFVARLPFYARHCGQVQPYGPSDESGNLHYDAVTLHGNSGSAVYNMRGELVAIVTHLIECGNGQICGGAATAIGGE